MFVYNGARRRPSRYSERPWMIGPVASSICSGVLVGQLPRSELTTSENDIVRGGVAGARLVDEVPALSIDRVPLGSASPTMPSAAWNQFGERPRKSCTS